MLRRISKLLRLDRFASAEDGSASSGGMILSVGGLALGTVALHATGAANGTGAHHINVKVELIARFFGF